MILVNFATALKINRIGFELLILISTVLAFAVIGYLVYRKSINKKQLKIVAVTPSINYVENTLEMIQSSKNLFDDNMPKYAFEKFSQAIRYYYSNKLEINLDLTPSEMLSNLKKSNVKNFDEIHKWLQLCGQVEFVKHKSTQKEFLDSLNNFRKSIS